MPSGYERRPAIRLDRLAVAGGHHLLWACRGQVRLRLGERRQVLSQGQACWLPAGVPVALIETDPGSVALALPVPAHRHPSAGLPPGVRPLAPAFEDALVAAFARWVMPFWVSGGTTRTVEDAGSSTHRPSGVAMPPVPERSPASQVAMGLLRDPADARTAREWAALALTSERHLTRCFLAETGMTFRGWRTSLRVAQAHRLLYEGFTPSDVAAAVGYGSTSALDHAFRRLVGTVPSRIAAGTESRTVDGPLPSAFSGDDVFDRVRRRSGGAHARAVAPVIPAASTRMRVNDFHVFIWMYRGSAVVELGAARITLLEGQAMWLPAGHANRIRTDEGAVVLPIGFVPANVVLERADRVPRSIPPHRAPEMLYRSVASYTLLRPRGYDAMHMLDFAGAAIATRTAAPDSLAPLLAVPVNDARTLGDWAVVLGVPVDQLARRFRRLTGSSYRQWRRDRRMTFAQDRLARAHATPGEVAAELGYSDQSAFTRAFTRHHGVTPSAFRRSHRDVRHVVAGITSDAGDLQI